MAFIDRVKNIGTGYYLCDVMLLWNYLSVLCEMLDDDVPYVYPKEIA